MLAELGLMAPRFSIAMARISLLTKIAKKKYTEAICAVYYARHNKASWMAAVKDDLAWVANADNRLTEMRNADMAQWIRLFLTHWTATSRLLKDVFTKATVTFAQANTKQRVMTLQWNSHCCHICQEFFDTRQAKAVHLARKHKALRLARQYTGGKQCVTCLQQFAQRSRLPGHYSEKSNICSLNLLLHCAPLDEAKVKELDEEDRQLEKRNRRADVRHNHSATRTVQAHGPLHRLVVPQGHSRQSRHIPLMYALKGALEVELAMDMPYGGVAYPDMGELVRRDLQRCQEQLDVDDAFDALPEQPNHGNHYGGLRLV